MLQYILSFQTQQHILSLDIYMAGKLIQSIFIEQNTVINITGNHFTMFSVNHLFDKKCLYEGYLSSLLLPILEQGKPD